jgi:carbamoyl-phosphate synthase large subunit
MKRILVDGAGGPAGINFVNSLRDSGEKMQITGTDTNKYHLELPDLDQRILMPESLNTDSIIEKLNEIIERTGAEFVHPQPDKAVLAMSENREKINALTFLPSKRTIRICQDKFESARIWKKTNIPAAKAIFIDQTSDFAKVEKEFGYPYWLRATRGASSRGSTLVTNRRVAEHWFGYWKAREDVDWDFMAQEYLPGRIIAFQSIWKDGEIVTSQARERLEYLYPQLAPSGITNTPVVSVTINRKGINDVATNCVLAIDKRANGIFCVDLREDKNGIPCPTEINAGRFFTTSYFFTRAGINMPYYYVKLAYGEEIPDLPKYNALPEGLYWIRHMDAMGVLRRDGQWKSTMM